MAKKTDQRAPVENNEQAPIADATEQTPEELHTQARAERRELETELTGIDDQIRNAIAAGNVEELEKLTARKAELPKLFMAASIAESKARHEIFNAEDAVNSEMLQSAEAERDKLKEAITKRRREFEAEMAEMNTRLNEVNQQIGALYATIAAQRNLGSDHEAGFRRSLAKLAGV